jgi:adenylate cyclase
MTTRTFEELQDAIHAALSHTNDKALLQCAAELDALGTVKAGALASNTRGTTEHWYGNHTAALEHYQRALVLFEDLGDLEGVARSAGNIGTVHQSIGNYLEALEHYYRSMDALDKLGNRALAAIVSMGIGDVHAKTRNFPAALESYHHALAYHKERDNRDGEANISTCIGNVLCYTGSYPEALEHHHRALAIHEDSGNRIGMAFANTGIGLVHYRAGNYSVALENYHRALVVHEELCNRTELAVITTNIGNTHGNAGNLQEALEYFHRAMALFEEIGDQTSAAAVLANITAALEKSGFRSEAEKQLEKLDAVQIVVPSMVITREQTRASIQENKGDSEGAAATLRAALEIAREYTLIAEQASLHKALRDLCQKNNDFAGYIEHNNNYTRITEEVNGKDTATRLAIADKQREIDSREKEYQKHLAVLHSTLPKHIADRVARGEVVNDTFDIAAVLFLDVVGFTTHTSALDASVVVQLLQDIFTTFDGICAKNDVMKIKTIGDSYMAVAFPIETSESRTTNNEQRLTNVALAMQAAEFTWPHTGERVQFRVGMHCGPVVAGVIGTQRLQYDVWGDTVNVASRMESTGEPGRIHVSEAFATLLSPSPSHLRERGANTTSEGKEGVPVIPSVSEETEGVPVIPSGSEEPGTWHVAPGTWHLELRGETELKGKGMMTTYWLMPTDR